MFIGLLVSKDTLVTGPVGAPATCMHLPGLRPFETEIYFDSWEQSPCTVYYTVRVRCHVFFGACREVTADRFATNGLSDATG